MRSRAVALLLVALGLTATVDVLLLTRKAARRRAHAAATVTTPAEWRAPDFAYVDQDGHPFRRADLDGHVWIADFIFTQCRGACPMLTARMLLLQRQLAGADVHFVSFSIDPAHDTPAALHDYADRWHADQSRWHLLSTTAQALPATAAGLHALYAATGNADEPLVHSDRFVLVDAQGRVRGVFDSDDEEERRQLVAEARRLAAPVLAQVSPPSDGAALFSALGCRGCHDRPELAPPLAGLFGSTVLLADGTRVTADEDYVRDSILAPASHVVAGYGPTMPSYAGQLSNAQQAALIAFLRAPEAAPATAKMAATMARTPRQGGRQRVIDPVCKMEVSVAPDDAWVERDGHRYYFCSDRCRQKFLRTPGSNRW